MSNLIATPPEWTQRNAGARRALVACGLWMRVAFIGASATAVGVIQFFEGEWSTLRALFCAGAGIALAILSWRRAHAALSDADNPPTISAATPAAAHR